MQYSTQLTSGKRVKKPNLTNIDLQFLYDAYELEKLGNRDRGFKMTAIELIERGSGNQSKKDIIINAIINAKTKEVVLKKCQDFILAGMGLGV